MKTFDAFFDRVERLAKKIFSQRGEHLPVFYVAEPGKPDHIATLPAPWQTLLQKEMLLRSMRTGIDLGIFSYCCFVSEMWWAVEDRPATGAVDIGKIVPPSQRADRRELLAMVGIDRTSFKMAQWLIERTNGKPRLMTFPFPDGRMDMLSAGFRAFIGEDRQKLN